MCCFVFIFQLLRIYLCILFYFILCILKIDDGEHQISVLYFKDKLQLKLFILFLGFGLITLLFSQKLLELGWYIGVMIAWFVLYFTTNLVMFKKRSK